MYDCLTGYFTRRPTGECERSQYGMAACLRLPRQDDPSGKLELIETNTFGHYDLVVQARLPRRTRSPTTKTPRTAAVRTIHSSPFSTKNSLRSDLFTF